MRKVFYLASLLALVSCGHRTDRNRDRNGNEDLLVEEDTITIITLGADRDEHGCIGSAGYVWSQVRQDCIRPFETGVQLVSVTDSLSPQAGYIVFSEDSTMLELFLPGQDSTQVMNRRELPEGVSWRRVNDDRKNVRRVNGDWVVEQDGKILYAQRNTAIPASFTGTDGRTKRLYQVSVMFYPAEDRAVVKTDDGTYNLKQYVTGSGYGYRNGSVDLRGKGSEATLTLGDSLTLTLQEKK